MTTLILTLAALAAALFDGSLFELQRGGDAWRIVTCHFTHFTHEQLAWDVLAFLVLGIACERRSRTAFHATLLASAIVIPLAVLAFDPRIETYRGLSGLDSALFALLVVSTRNRFLGAAFAAKIAFELATGGAVFVGDITVVPVAHVAGAITGAISGQLLRKSKDEALGRAHEAEPVDVLVLRNLADQLHPVAAQARHGVVDVVDREHDAADAERVRGRVLRLDANRRRPVKLRQLDAAVAVRSAHHGDVGANVLESDHRVRPAPLHRRAPFELHPELGEERHGSIEILDDDENVVHALNAHRRGP